MTQTRTTDPLASTWGLMPRYMRERLAAEAAEQVNAPAPAAPLPVVSDFYCPGRRVDTTTTDLRRRIAAAQAPRRLPLAMMAPAFAGLSLAIGALLSQ